MKPDEITWQTIFEEPFVTLVLGARGEGKTALSHELLEQFKTNDRDAYILGFPPEKKHLLPDDVELLDPGVDRSTWPENSVVLIHEAHQLLHARRSMDGDNLEIDKLVTISRHKDSNIIFETQQSHRLDKNSVAAVDGIIMRWPALMQEEFERRALRPIVKDARGALEQFVTIHDEDDYTFVERDEDDDGVELLKKHAYVHADRFRGLYPQEIGLADHWSEEISKAYSGIEGESATQDGPSNGTSINSLSELRENNGR